MVDAGAACHAPYPYGLFWRRGDAEELVPQFPKRQRGLLQQVVDFHAVATVATADREEQPAVVVHRLAERILTFHTIITFFGGTKLQPHKKKPADYGGRFFTSFLLHGKNIFVYLQMAYLTDKSVMVWKRSHLRYDGEAEKHHTTE